MYMSMDCWPWIGAIGEGCDQWQRQVVRQPFRVPRSKGIISPNRLWAAFDDTIIAGYRGDSWSGPVNHPGAKTMLNMSEWRSLTGWWHCPRQLSTRWLQEPEIKDPISYPLRISTSSDMFWKSGPWYVRKPGLPSDFCCQKMLQRQSTEALPSRANTQHCIVDDTISTQSTLQPWKVISSSFGGFLVPYVSLSSNLQCKEIFEHKSMSRSIVCTSLASHLPLLCLTVANHFFNLLVVEGSEFAEVSWVSIFALQYRVPGMMRLSKHSQAMVQK